MAKVTYKKPVPPKPKPKPKPITANPFDWLRGSKIVGQKYTAWDTYGQGRPDFGKQIGPGDPYHEIQKTVVKGSEKPPVEELNAARGITGGLRLGVRGNPNASGTVIPQTDPRTEAIRRRLRGL